MYYSLATLLALPIIESGNFSDLLINTNKHRLWLSRMTVEEGMPYNNQVLVETYDDERATWKELMRYEAR